ncbi:MAG: O-antigen ligase family protein [Anaerolineaceae bacterium]|nr:O-antigen ligase family protein [Anaerolineaceae bacterium]
MTYTEKLDLSKDRFNQTKLLSLPYSKTMVEFLFSIIALQGLLELVLNASPLEGSGAGTFLGNKLLRGGLYIFFSISGLFLIKGRLHKPIIVDKSMRFLIFFYIEIFIVILLGSIQANQNSLYPLEDVRQLLEVYILIPLVYLSVKNIKVIHNSLNFFSNLLTVVALLNLINYIGNFTLSLRLPTFSSLFPIIILFGATLSLARFLSSKLNIWRIIQLIILYGGAFITFHKPVIFCGIFGAIFIFLVFIFNKKKTNLTFRTSLISKTALVILIATSFLLVLNFIASNRLLDKYQYLYNLNYSKSISGGSIDGMRFLIWDTTWNNLIQNNPLLGTGWGTKVNVFYQDNVYIHNFFIYWIASTGFIGAFVLILLIIAFGIYLIEKLNLQKDTSIKVGLLGCLSIIVAFNLVGITFAEPALTYSSGIIIGLLLRIVSYA